MRRLQTSYPDQFPGRLLARFSIAGYAKKEACRKTAMLPSTLAILSGKTDKDQYTIFLNVDHGIRVYPLFMALVLLILRQCF